MDILSENEPGNRKSVDEDDAEEYLSDNIEWESESESESEDEATYWSIVEIILRFFNKM